MLSLTISLFSPRSPLSFSPVIRADDATPEVASTFTAEQTTQLEAKQESFEVSKGMGCAGVDCGAVTFSSYSAHSALFFFHFL